MAERKLYDSPTVCDIYGIHDTEFCCEEYNVLICRFCKPVSHKDCSLTNLHTLDQAALEDVNTAIITQLKIFEDTAERTLKERIDTAKMVKETVRENQNDMKNLRVETDNMFDQYEASLGQYETQNSERLTAEIETCTSVRCRVQEEIGLLERRTHLEGIALARTLFLAKQITRTLGNVLEALRDGLTPTSIFVEKNREHVRGIVQKLSSLFRLEEASPEQITDQRTTLSSPIENKTFWTINSLSRFAEIDLKTMSDTHVPEITGCEFIQDDQIILCDNKNGKLKILGYGFKLKYEMPLYKPFDVTRVDEKRVLISVPTANYLQWVDTAPGLKLGDSLRVGNSCYGIDFRNDKIYACVVNIENRYGSTYTKKDDYITFNGIKMFSTTGGLLKSIRHVGEGRPRYLTVNSEGTKIFYSGKSDKEGFVTCTTETEHGIYKYTGKMLADPTTVLLDAEENLLVCDTRTKVLLGVNPNGVSCKCFLTEMDKLDTPMSMCCNEKENMLCVATADTLRCVEQMKVFILT